ncbi:MAG: potassium-transporting ATPase subunit KdpB [Candidatus Melainabacteria bacterium]|nr:potassium-transporting ATPase subunit KdpB [Candidatus Melainabacteria bacterium]
MATKKRQSILSLEIIKQATIDSLIKLNPVTLFRNPVMFVVEVVAILTTIFFILNLCGITKENLFFVFQIAAWLWVTVIFGNFSEAMAEGRGKAQANSLRQTKLETKAKLLKDINDKEYKLIPGTELKKGDIVLAETGSVIPGDGEIVEGVALIDESAITGESAAVLKQSGSDKSSVIAGTKVISDWIKIKITSNPGESFLDQMIALVEGAKRQKTPNEIALCILLVGMTIVFLIATATIEMFALYAGTHIPVTILIALLVTLIPTTIGGLLSAIGIAGIDRLVQHNVLAMSGSAVEAAGDVDTLLLDKTGTITFGNRMADEFIPLSGVNELELADAAQLSSLSDETPEGRSIVKFAKDKYQLRERNLSQLNAEFIPFTAQTRMSGVNFENSEIRKGSTDAILDYIKRKNNDKSIQVPQELTQVIERISTSGGTPLVVARNDKLLGVIHLKDIVKGGMRERFEELRKMGIRTIMITGDNPLTARAISKEAGLDDFLAEAKPQDKLELIRKEQTKGKLLAMTGDGTNDAPALAQADVGVAMSSGTQAAKEAANMIDLDSNPTKLIEIVGIGKQLLITRGALTTFSIANDVAKYFAIIPAMFYITYPELGALNVMKLATPHSAILSAVIFNALIILLLLPLALKGVVFKPLGAAAILRKNLLIYGLGGIVVPFIGIKVIDILVNFLHLV